MFLSQHRVLATLIVVVCTSASLQTQTLYGIDAAGPTVAEFTGPSDPGLCSYPNGPVVSSFPAFGPFVCGTVGPFPAVPALAGDIAVNKRTDTVWATDGVRFTEYTPAGVVITSFAMPVGVILPGVITGLGFDSSTGTLWATDGAFVVGLIPPPTPGCVLPGVAVAPFAPFLILPGALTDVTWDPFSGSLWACDAAGFIHNFFPGGAPASPSFMAAGTCPLASFAPLLTGIAYDTTTPGALSGAPALYVTDGKDVAYITPGGGAAAVQFYTPFNCAPVPGFVTSGLAFSLRAITYGTAVDPAGTPPAIGSVGQSYQGNPAWGLTLSGATPGGFAYVLADSFPACPPLPFYGLYPFYVAPTVIFGPFGVPATGSITLSAALTPPAIYAVGAPIHLQWVVDKMTGVIDFEVSEGLRLTIGSP